MRQMLRALTTSGNLPVIFIQKVLKQATASCKSTDVNDNPQQ